MKKKEHPIWKIISAILLFGIALYSVPFLSPALLLIFMRRKINIPTERPPKDFPLYQQKVSVKKDISYDSKYSSGFLDLYRPTEKTSVPLPTILWVPGGAYIGGNKSDISIFATMLAAHGYAVAVMNYELAPKARYPEPVFQVQEAHDFLKKHQKVYRLDMDAFSMAGDSAGAQIASQFALVHTRADYGGMMDFAPEKASISAMLLYCGIYDKDALSHLDFPFSLFRDQIAWAYLGRRDWHYYSKIEYASIVDMLDENFPPSFITDGSLHSFPEHADSLYQHLKNNDVYVQQLSFPEDRKLPHEYQFLLDTSEGMKAFKYTLAFLESTVLTENHHAP